MSHIVEIQTEVRDVAAIRAACERLKLPAPVEGEVQLFSSQATGWSVHLEGWRYPVVCDTANGQLRYDNYNGRWGVQERLNEFMQRYAVEKARIESHRKGHTITEQKLDDGSVKLTINVGGAA